MEVHWVHQWLAIFFKKTMQIFIMCTYLYLLLNKYNHCNKTKNEAPLSYQYFFKAAFMKKKKQNSLKLNCVLLVGSYKVIEEIFTQSNPETVALFAFLETMFAVSLWHLIKLNSSWTSSKISESVIATPLVLYCCPMFDKQTWCLFSL